VVGLLGLNGTREEHGKNQNDWKILMATVPTAMSLGLGTEETTPDQTPLQNMDTEAVFAGKKVQSQQLADAGSALTSTATNVQNAMDAVNRRADTIDRARQISTYSEDATKILQTASDTSDLSKPEAIADLRRKLQTKQDELLGLHGGSADSLAALTAQLEAANAGFLADGAAKGVARQKEIVSNFLKDKVGGITARALKEPGKINEYFAEWDKEVAGMKDGLDPSEELAQIETGRSAIVLSSIDAFTSRGDFLSAKKLIDENPMIMKNLDSTQQRKVVTEIASGLAAQRKLNNAGTIKLQEAKQILGRDLTPSERLNLAGLAKGTQTWEEKIDDMEKVLGRELTENEMQIALGLKPKPSTTSSSDKLQSKKGKIIGDLKILEGLGYNRNSPQYKAVEDSLDDESDAKLTEIAGVRKEFTKLSDPFIKLRDAYLKIQDAARDPSPAGDLSLIFAYMKMLDPGSTVREGEFANAENSGSIPQRIWSLYNKTLTREGRLEQGIRLDFLIRAKGIMRTQYQSHINNEKVFKTLATKLGMDPKKVVIDFKGDMLPSLKQEFEESQPGTGTEDDDNQVEIDLSGKPITAGQAENKVPPKTEAKAGPQKQIDFSTMDEQALSKVDITKLNDKQKKAMMKRFNELEK